MGDTVFLCDVGSQNQFTPAALLPCQNDGNYLGALVLNKLESTIGRDSSCDHSIISMEISRKHALIKYENNAWWIYDLRSTNGIFVQDVKLKPNGKVRLEDGASVCLGPPDQGHFKFFFREKFQPSDDSQAFCLDKSSPISFVLPSGYDSVATQDLHSCRPSALESHQVEVYLSEIARLKSVVSKMEFQLKNQKENSKHLYKNVQVTQQLLKEKESRCSKYRTLISQLESCLAQSRCSSDDESSNERACTESSPFGGHAAVSSALREITCSICSEYLISPTALSCSHVFCLHCIEAWKKEYRLKPNNSFSNGVCPVCRKEVEHQTQPLAFENLINIILENVLSYKELSERRILVEARKKQPLASSSSHQLNQIITQILNGVTRNRRSSITIPSENDQVQSGDDDEEEDDDDEDDDDDDDDGGNGGGGGGGSLNVQIDYNQEVELNLQLSDIPSDEDEIDISITVSSASNLQEVLDAQDSDAEILMIGNADDDDDMSNDSNPVMYLLEEDSASEATSSSDSEDSREAGGRRRRRRSSMIILSDNDNGSLPVATIDVMSTTAASGSGGGGGGGGGNGSSIRVSQNNQGNRTMQSARRVHPYQRGDRSNNGNASNSISRRHQVCV